MKKIYMLLYLLVVVDIKETNQQKQTSHLTRSYRRFLFKHGGFLPKCRDQLICRIVWNYRYCWPEEICTP